MYHTPHSFSLSILDNNAGSLWASESAINILRSCSAPKNQREWRRGERNKKRIYNKKIQQKTHRRSGLWDWAETSPLRIASEQSTASRLKTEQALGFHSGERITTSNHAKEKLSATEALPIAREWARVCFLALAAWQLLEFLWCFCLGSLLFICLCFFRIEDLHRVCVCILYGNREIIAKHINDIPAGDYWQLRLTSKEI